MSGNSDNHMIDRMDVRELSKKHPRIFILLLLITSIVFFIAVLIAANLLMLLPLYIYGHSLIRYPDIPPVISRMMDFIFGGDEL